MPHKWKAALLADSAVKIGLSGVLEGVGFLEGWTTGV